MEQQHRGETKIERGKRFIEQVLKKVGNKTLSEIAEERYEEEYPDLLSGMKAFLPIAYQDTNEQQYIQALLFAAQTSYENGLYQFACIQYHMQFMTAIYFVLLKLYHLHTDEVNKALFYLLKKERKKDFDSRENTKNGKLYFGSFAIIPESDVFLLLRIMGMSDSLLDDLQKRVVLRNKFAHANGNLMLTSDELFAEEIGKYDDAIEKTTSLMKSDIIKLYKDTITAPDFYDPEIRGYMEPEEQILEGFIRANSISLFELNWLRKIQAKDFDKIEGARHIKDLHYALCHFYDMATLDDPDYSPINDEYYRHKYKNNARDFAGIILGCDSMISVQGYPIYYPISICPNCKENQLVTDHATKCSYCFSCGKTYDTEEYNHEDEDRMSDDCIEESD